MIVWYKNIFVGPVNAAGQAYDPAAETYKKQVGLYRVIQQDCNL